MIETASSPVLTPWAVFLSLQPLQYPHSGQHCVVLGKSGPGHFGGRASAWRKDAAPTGTRHAGGARASLGPRGPHRRPRRRLCSRRREHASRWSTQ